jgi:hypothetical protein
MRVERKCGQKKIAKLLVVVGIDLVVLCGLLAASSGNQNKGTQASVARGKYLVEEVAKCGECHTPRDAEGNVNRDSWLQGATIWIMPVRPIKDWADSVPPLAGLPNLTAAQVETVLENGTGPNGEVLRPPMHIYHMNQTDAQSIAAYLKSLPSPPK